MAIPTNDKGFNPFETKTMDNGAIATRPGMITLSQERLRRMHPSLYNTPEWMFWQRARYKRNQLRILQIEERLKYGLAEPAIVHCLDPLLIGVYSAELDAVVLLAYLSDTTPHPVHGEWYPKGLAEELIKRHKLQEGTRLLAVNTFFWLHEEPYSPDLRPGPGARGVYSNFSTLIADFMTLDLVSVQKRKAIIEESEWQRCDQLIEEYFFHMVDTEVEPRDGRPFLCSHGREQNWLPGHAPAHVSRSSDQ